MMHTVTHKGLDDRPTGHRAWTAVPGSLEDRPMASEDRLHLRVNVEHGKTRVEVHGEIDAHSAGELDEGLSGIVLAGETNVVLDLVGVDFMDSTGMRAVVAAQKMVADRDGTLELVNVSPTVHRALAYAGLVDHLSIQEA